MFKCAKSTSHQWHEKTRETVITIIYRLFIYVQSNVYKLKHKKYRKKNTVFPSHTSSKNIHQQFHIQINKTTTTRKHKVQPFEFRTSKRNVSHQISAQSSIPSTQTILMDKTGFPRYRRSSDMGQFPAKNDQ